MNGRKDIDPESELSEEDEDSALPELELEAENAAPGTLAAGRAAMRALPSSRPRRPASTA